MPSAPLITVIGSLNVDLVTYTPRHPTVGETLLATAFHTGIGGKGANQAVACAKLSRHRNAINDGSVIVKMIGAVGQDEHGSNILQQLKKYGIDSSGVEIRQDHRTGVAIIIVDESSGDNRILLSMNSNSSLKPDGFQSLPAPLPTLLIVQLEIPLDTVLAITRAARRERVSVLLNPAPAQVLPLEHLDGLAHLILNETEAANSLSMSKFQSLYPANFAVEALQCDVSHVNCRSQFASNQT